MARFHITPKVPAVGTKTLQRRTSEMKLSIVLDDPDGGAPRAIHIDRGDTEARREEVKAVTVSSVTAVRVTFVEMNAHETRNDKPQPVPTPTVVGKTYLVSHEGSTLKIVDETGQKPSDRENATVVQAFEHLGKSDPMMAAIPQGRMRVGDHVLAMETFLPSILASDSRTKVHDVSVVLSSVDDAHEVATFDVTAIAEGDAGPVITVTKYAGRLRLRIADGAPLELTLEGPVNAVTNEAAHPPGHPRGKRRRASVADHDLRVTLARRVVGQVAHDDIGDLVTQLLPQEIRAREHGDVRDGFHDLDHQEGRQLQVLGTDVFAP